MLDVLHDTMFANNMQGILRNRETLWLEAQAEINESIEGRVDLSADHAIMMGLNIIAAKLRQRSGVIG